MQRCVFYLSWLLVVALGQPGRLQAHPMPSSLVLLDIEEHGVAAELQLPLQELQPALPTVALLTDSTHLLARSGAALRAYVLAHVHPVGPDGRPWTVSIRGLRMGTSEQPYTGAYPELTVLLWLQPPAGASARAFTLHYDVIIHQVVTHSALVSIRRDWDSGVLADHPAEVGVIRMSPRDNTINVVAVSATAGSRWRGFHNMVDLGMSHISEGTDHLLFLLVLLLPAPLLVAAGRRWGCFGGLRYSLGRLLRIVTAFTLGHSLTLLLGALGWVRLPTQPIEVLIAVSILVSAVHAWRPLFAGREAWVAGGFGLVHGLAFASTLAGLHLDAGRLGLSILGFNLGIELMQLFIIALTVPWLVLLSCTPYYRWVRVGGAVVAATAATAWLAERLSGNSNALTRGLAQAVPYAPWLLGLLALAALGLFWVNRPAVVGSENSES